MGKFAQIREVRPLRCVAVPPTAWADDYLDKPAGEVAIGLRFISQADADKARREAEREAVGFYAQLRQQPLPSDPQVAIDVQRDTLMALAVARGTCDPNDVTKPYFAMAEELVPQVLTPEGIRLLYDELVILHKGSSPGRPIASDDDVQNLARVLAEGVILDSEARKLCAYLLEKLDIELGATVVEADGDVVIYEARSA